MLKIIAVILIPLLFIGGILFFARDWLISNAFESLVTQLTGFAAAVKSFRVDLSKGELHLRELILLNPDGFEEKVFADVPEIYIRLDLAPLLRKERVHLHELRLNIQRFNVEKNSAGVSNLSLLKSLKRTPAPGAKKKPPMPFRLDRLELTVRRVRYEDPHGIVPKKISMDLHVRKQVFEDIEDPKAIVNIIVMKIINSTPLGAISDLGINPLELKNQLTGTVGTVRNLGEKVLIDKGTVIVGTTVGKTADIGKKVLSEGTETLGNVGTTAKDELTGLFGKLKSKVTSE